MYCSNCNKEISSEKAICLENGTVVCYACLEYLKEQKQDDERNRMMQITKEMAIDAGDRNLEGKWVMWW